MPDQPNDTPPQPDPDDQRPRSTPRLMRLQPQSTRLNAPAAPSRRSRGRDKPLHLTRAVAIGTAAGILLVGGVAGLAIGATLAGDDSDGRSAQVAAVWHVERRGPGRACLRPRLATGDWRRAGHPTALRARRRQGGSTANLSGWPSDGPTRERRRLPRSDSGTDVCVAIGTPLQPEAPTQLTRHTSAAVPPEGRRGTRRKERRTANRWSRWRSRGAGRGCLADRR